MSSRPSIFRTVISSLCVVALAAAPAVLAQDGGMVSVLNVHVKLGEQQRYESALPKLWAAFKKAGVTAQISVSASVDDPGTYTLVAPVASFAELGTLRDAVNSAFVSAPQVAAEIAGLSTSQDQSIWAGRPDLSYVPASPRLKDSEQGYSRVAFVYPHPNQVQAFEAALKEAVAMYTKHGLTDARFVAQLVLGADAPAYVVLLGAKDEADFYTQNAKNVAKMGTDWPAYLAKTGPMLRSVDIGGASARPALTYQP